MAKRFTLKTLILSLSVLLLNFSISSSQANSPDIMTVLKNGDNQEKFSRLVDLLEVTGLDKVLKENGPYTLFAPTDKAFDKYDENHPNVINDLVRAENGLGDLKKILLNHVMSAKITEDQIDKLSSNESESSQANMAGEISKFGSNDDYYTINNANILESDIEATNGTIHVIDTLLVPALP